MDEVPQFEPEFTTESAFEEQGSSSASYTGAFFPKAKHFVITGGIFNSIHHAAPRAASAYRTIPLGDLDLVKEIRTGTASGVVRHRKGRASVRRIYSARLHGSGSTMTAVLYQGEGAEKQWRDDISRYASLRHPYLLQLYGIANTDVVHAMVFHDDLIPQRDVWQKYRNSHFLEVYFYAGMASQYRDAKQYILSISGTKLHWSMYTIWVRPSTGRLCIELTPPESAAARLSFVDTNAGPSGTLLDQPDTTEIIRSISNREYHAICSFHLPWNRWFSVSTYVSVQLGSIRHLSGTEYESSFEIAVVSDNAIVDEGWRTEDPDIEGNWLLIKDSDPGTLILDNGWIRVASENVADTYARRIFSAFNCPSGWLAQAHHIYNSLAITSDFEAYVLVRGIQYYLWLSGSIDDLPPGYLFLCCLANFQTEFPARCQIPECAAYWALNPEGTEPLGPAEARTLGFPNIELLVEVRGISWDSSVYTGVRQFQEAKGLDPYSQDAALDAGYQLFRGTCERDELLAHLQGNDTDDGCSSDSGNEDYASRNISVEDEPDVGIDLQSDDLAEVAPPSAQTKSTHRIFPETSLFPRTPPSCKRKRDADETDSGRTTKRQRTN